MTPTSTPSDPETKKKSSPREAMQIAGEYLTRKKAERGSYQPWGFHARQQEGNQDQGGIGFGRTWTKIEGICAGKGFRYHRAKAQFPGLSRPGEGRGVSKRCAYMTTNPTRHSVSVLARFGREYGGRPGPGYRDYYGRRELKGGGATRGMDRTAIVQGSKAENYGNLRSSKQKLESKGPFG